MILQHCHSSVPEPHFEQTYYVVPESGGSVQLCIDVGVEVFQETLYTITAIYNSPPEAQGHSSHNFKCLHMSVLFPKFQILFLILLQQSQWFLQVQ